MTKNITLTWNNAKALSRRNILKGLAFSALAASIFPTTSLMAHAATNPKVLIAYFSHTGNTKAVAQTIQAAVGGDLLEIKVQQAYSPEHNVTVARAEQEWEGSARPQLSMAFPADMSVYDTIFVGYPNWFRTTPMAVLTFLEHFTFAGKTLVPFCTHGGNGLGDGPRDIAKSCPQATVLDGLAIREKNATNAADVKEAVSSWLQKSTQLAQLVNK